MSFEWIDDRWHYDGQPIYAGSIWTLVCDEGDETVRIESANRGRELIAFTRVKGREFASRIETSYDTLKPV